MKNKLFYLSWILMFMNALNFDPLGKSINYMIRVVTVLMTIALLLLFLYKNNNIRIPKRLLMFIFSIYIFFNFFSIIYSVARLETFVKCAELMGVFLLIISFFQLNNYGDHFKKVFNLTMKLLLITLLVTLIGYIVSPPLFSLPSRGLFSLSLGNTLLHPNSVGSLSSLLLIITLIDIVEKKRGNILFSFVKLFFCLLSLILAQSRTGLVVLVISAILCLILYRKYILLLFSTLFTYVLYINNSDLIHAYFIRGQSDGNFKSLSGRTLMWAEAKETFLDSPIIGFGFGAGSNSILSGTEISSLHNGFFETLLGTGIIGVFFLLSILILITITIGKKVIFYNKTDDFWKVICLICLYLLIRTTTSMGFGGWFNIDYLIYIIVFIYSLIRMPIQKIYHS